MEKTKEQKRLIEITNSIIGDLVKPNSKIIKAYNYYEGVRNKEQFAYLEDNYGIGSPTSLTFTPIGRNHLNVLVGEYLNIPIKPRVTCKDEKTLTSIMREKQLYIINGIKEELGKHLRNTLISFINGNQTNDPVIEYQLKQLEEHLSNTFVSDYEVTAQNIVQYIIQSRNIKFKDKLKQILLDLLISGKGYYKIIREGESLNIEILDPRTTYVNRSFNSNYYREGSQSVSHTRITRADIISRYKKDLTKDQIKAIKGDIIHTNSNNNTTYLTVNCNEGVPVPDMEDGLHSGLGLGVNYDDYNFTNNDKLDVYEVEWIELDKDNVQQLYKTVKISGGDIYILLGKDENATRDFNNPDKCYLSINGVAFNVRSKKDYSLMLATADLQDKYDITIFYRDQYVASSGVSGDFLDVSMLPSFLQGTVADRIVQWKAYKKAGTAMIETKSDNFLQQDDKPMNTLFAGYDDSIKGATMQAFDMVLAQIERNFETITGVFRERIGGILQKDAVTNVQVGMNNSFNVTKQYFEYMDTLMSEALIDFLNVAKVAWKKGKTLSLIVGNYQQDVFTALPKNFTLTDFDIHVLSGSEILEEIETIKALVLEFTKGGIIDPDIIVDVSTCKSLTEVRRKLYSAVKQKKEETNVINKLSEQVQQYEQQLKQLEQQLKEASTELQKNNQQKLELEYKKHEDTIKLKWFEARALAGKYNDDKDTKDKLLDIEQQELRDGNPRNDEIVNIGL